MYCSQDPIGLAGGEPNFYSYVHDSNGWVDPFGLSSFVPKPITEGSVFRGSKAGQPPFSPSSGDIAHFKETGKMPGLSTKPKYNSQAKKFFEKIGASVKEIDVTKLSDLSVIQDGKAHASIMPSDDYLKNNNMTMLEALEDWSKGGDDHQLSKELKNASKCL